MYFLLFLLWIVFNGQLTLEIAVIGAFVAGLVYWFVCRFMGYHYERDLYICRRAFKILRYILVLVWEILKANAATMGFVLSARKKPDPVLITFTVDLKTNTGKVLLANSITLTPGTITVGLEGDRYTVHCLDRSMAEGIDQSVFVRLIADMEGDYQGYLEKRRRRKDGGRND